MSHVERRTARSRRRARKAHGRAVASRLALLILAALALLASSCAGSDNSNSGIVTDVRAPQTTQAPSANAIANQSGAAGKLGYDGKELIARQEGAAGESYAKIDENPFLDAARAPLSTFAVDVDTASYSNTRRFLSEGQLPPKDAVRIEELINYFPYDYPQPAGNTPFSVKAEVADCPWDSRHKLVHIGLQGRRLAAESLPPANLVFLVDVSGSMASPDKLPLVKSSLRTLAGQLTGRDRVAVVVYAGSSGLALPSTPGDRREEILSAVERLEAGGSTNGGQGIQLAYRIAEENFIRGGTNRVVLATDGDFNVGLTSDGELVNLIEEKRRGGVFLSVLGFGTGNLNDSMMEKLADKGNGNYAYIDTPAEARKALGEQVAGTLATIAKDVKIQVEFNPRLVAGYRLIGYENRLLADRDFNDDRKDAGEIGAGHTVTALYEIVPAGQRVENPGVDELKYREPEQTRQEVGANELLTVKLRYKEPDGDVSKPLNVGVPDSGASFQNASADFKFAAAVAEFGMLLRGSRYRGQSSFDNALELARASAGADLRGYRAEFVGLVETARRLSPHGTSD
ncbi:MAG TPA: VWA domain-containing protein [Pyrinomonadaceae bacterium]|nr:VWA domain-containing protein [Pyrinomonadaceae bacterium]